MSVIGMFVCEYVVCGWMFVLMLGLGDEGEGVEGDASEVVASESVTEEKMMIMESVEDGGWVFGIKN